MPAEGIIAQGRAIGVSFSDIAKKQFSFFTAIVVGYTTSIDITQNIVTGMIEFFGGLFRGVDGALAQVAGPIGIAGLVGDAFETGFSQLIILTVMISLNLAVLNLIPFPALDGGQIVFVLWEAITGKTIKHSVIGIANIIGFALLIGLIIVITISDVFRLF
jgi:regulator of sigma E protease